MSVEFLKASLAGDVATATRWLGIAPPAEWIVGNQRSGWTKIRLAQLEADPTLLPWLLRAIILRATGEMIGHITFHTAPDPEYLQAYAAGGVELGYTIYPTFRRQGYATEAVAALMQWAVDQHGVARFVLSIRPDNLPSQRIAQHFGFRKVGTQIDEIDGPEELFVLETSASPKVQSGE
jgi:RimJ/RimL family protein N-acetyltransferase